MKTTLVALLLGAAVLAGPVAAAEKPAPAAPTTPAAATISPSQCPICRHANNQQAPFAEKATSTLLRGATNTAFGWTELLTEPTAEVERTGNLAVGVGKGIGRAVTRTAAGIGELFTFWVPRGQDGYPSLTKDCPICTKPSP